MQNVGMKKQSPAIQIYSAAVILLASYLSGSDTYQCAVGIVVFSTPVCKVNRKIPVHEQLLIEAVANRRNLFKVNDAY